VLHFCFVFGDIGDVCRCVGQCPPWRFNVRADFLHVPCSVVWILLDEIFQVGCVGGSPG